jgi:hypothetical protein
MEIKNPQGTKLLLKYLKTQGGLTKRQPDLAVSLLIHPEFLNISGVI